MKRRLINALTILSLLACALFLVLWPLSYWVWCRADVGWAARNASAPGTTSACIARCGSWPGHLHLYVFRITDADASWWHWAWQGEPSPGPYASAAGWRYQRRSRYRQKPFIVARETRDEAHNPWTTPNGGNARRVVQWSFGAPYWFLAALAGVAPALRARRALRRRRERVRRSKGLCASCGYDLRATPGCCPECGAACGVPTAEASPVAPVR